MSRMHYIIRSFLAICMLCGIVETGQAQSGPTRSAPATTMRVVETRPQDSTTSVFTVTGAVERPGAYRTSHSSIPLRRLLDAAGGLSAQAQRTARIIRNGEVRYQVPLYQEQITTDEWLLPGDIVVIPVHAPAGGPASGVVPVVCVGLVNHPVVLPLDPAITTVPELVRRLGQSHQLALSSRTIDPTRGAQSALLTSGSVVFFDSRMIDSIPFQPGFLPEPIELDLSRTSAVPGPLPADLRLPPDVPPSETMQQVSAQLPFPTILPETPTLPAPTRQSATPAASTVPPMQLTAPDPAPAQEQASAREPASAPAAAKETVPQLPLPPDLAQAVELFASKPAAANPSPAHDQPALSDHAATPPVVREVRTAEAQQPTEEHSAPLAAVTQTGGLVTSLPPLKKESAPGILQSDSPAKSLSGQKGKSLSARTKSPPSPWTRVLEYLVYGGGTLCVLIGSCLLISVAANTHRAATISRIPETETPIQPTAAVSDQTSTTPVTSPATAVVRESISAVPTPETPDRVSQSTAVQPIQEILNRSIPMVEEPIQIPSSWPLHGKVIGHRRCLLNQSHEDIPGPHYRQRSKPPVREKTVTGAAVQSERMLRNHLREIFRAGPGSEAAEFPLEDSDDSGMNQSARPEFPVQSSPLETQPVSQEPVSTPHPVFTPVQAMSAAPSTARPSDEYIATRNGAEEFDIVQPQLSPTEPVSAMSPLERALRILAVEKHG